jgi:hypothetical protein
MTFKHNLNELWYETEEKIKQVTCKNKRKRSDFARSVPRLMRKRTGARVRAIQIQNRPRAVKLTAINEYRQA